MSTQHVTRSDLDHTARRMPGRTRGGGWAQMGAAVVALGLLAACGSEPTREDAISEFESVGFTTETAECLIDDLQDQGFEVGDLTGDLSAEVEDGLQVAVETCLTTGDLGGVIGSEDSRALFVDGLTESGQFDVEQAECIADRLESDGLSIAEASADADFESQVSEAVADCL